MGWRVELSDVQVTPLFPAEFEKLSVDEFMARLPELDAGFAAQAAEAKGRGEALRFAALVEGGKLVVGPKCVPLASPLGSLAGTDNLVEFYSKWCARPSRGGFGVGALALGAQSPPRLFPLGPRAGPRAPPPRASHGSPRTLALARV